MSLNNIYAHWFCCLCIRYHTQTHLRFYCSRLLARRLGWVPRVSRSVRLQLAVASSREGLPQRTPPYDSLRCIGQSRRRDYIDCSQFSHRERRSLIEYSGETGGSSCPPNVRPWLIRCKSASCCYCGTCMLRNGIGTGSRVRMQFAP